MDKRQVSPQELALIADAYDDCVASIDEQIGRLWDELEAARRSIGPGSSSFRTTARASENMKGFMYTDRACTRPSCTSRSWSFPLPESM